ncbi:MAG: TPM domain-containing protein [Myxococcota bacterium]
MKPSQLLTPEDRERIEQAVRDAERGTAGEIVVAVVRACDRHAAAPWRLAAWAAAAVLVAAAAFAPDARALELLAGVLVAGAAAHAACLLDPVRRALVPERELEERAQREARRAFAEHGLRRTEARTGILILVALFEHRVVVLGDEAIDRALGPDESWQQVVDAILEGLRTGRAADGIALGVRLCGAMLAHPLPPAPDDRDEIPHGLVLED